MSTGAASRLVLDASPLVHFQAADHLDVLCELVAERGATTTRAVLDEWHRHQGRSDRREGEAPEWLTISPVDSLPMLTLFAAYVNRLGRGDHNLGECTVLAVAESQGLTAVVVDDADAKAIGQARGVQVHGSLWLIINGLRRSVLAEREAERLVDALRDTNARLPCTGRDLLSWAESNGL